MDQLRPNQPNAAKLVTSLRNTGYDSYAAIEDIIDNSIDAQARTINIIVEHEQRNLRVIIGDNGMGMSEAVLDEALKLGSITDRDEVADLGKFGMGLCTASISMARKLEVITRKDEEEYFYSSQDLDEVIESNQFVKVLRKANQQEKVDFSRLAGEHGTIVILSKVDRLSTTNVSQFANKLSRDIGRIYRRFIESKIEFYVNGKKVEIVDPLMLDNPGVRIYSDETYELPGNPNKEKIRVKIAVLPEVNDELEKEKKMNIANQGFYVMRNNREVAMAQTLNVLTKHNDFNRLRAELYFSATLDSEMGVRFSKDGVTPNQAITDFLKQEIGGQIASIRTWLLRNKKTEGANIVDHQESEQVIAQKAKLLITPDVQVEKRSSRKGSADPRILRGDRLPHERKNFKDLQVSPKGLGVRFETASMGREGTLYETYQEGKIIIVRWNSDHPFYDRVVLANRDSKNIISALDYLIFALATAELKNLNEDNVELMANLKSIMSTNLRALLS